MSAATATVIGGHVPGAPRRGRATTSRHLVSVPTGAAVPTELRVTRRGRLALTTVVAALLVTTGVGLATAGEADQPATVTVLPGETLGEIAARQMPGVPASAAVADIRSANGLDTPFVHAGQELVIPQR